MKTLIEVEAYLATLIPRSRSFGDRLDHTKELLKKLGDPQNKLPAIHIAGTSGKGSTAYYCAALLKEAGYTVGLMVSPHVSKVSERAQVNGHPLSEIEYSSYITEFKTIIESFNEEVTYIEFLTCFAYWLFAKLKLDYMVIEVGLGGRLDSTNTITRKNTVRVITDIGLDHTEILGNTLDKIANEKAGIIHEGDVVCINRQNELIMNTIQAVAKKNKAQLIVVKPRSPLPYEPKGFQARNWQLALTAVAQRLLIDNHAKLTNSQLQGAAGIMIPGRFEVFKGDDETIVLDAAHNPQKVAALMNTIKNTYIYRPIVAVIAFGINKTTNVNESLDIIKNGANKVLYTEFTVEGDENRKAIKFNDSIVDPWLALTEARLWARENHGIVLVTGSFYLISNVRKRLMKEFGRTI